MYDFSKLSIFLRPFKATLINLGRANSVRKNIIEKFSLQKSPNPYHNQKFDTRNWKSGMEVSNFLTIYRNI